MHMAMKNYNNYQAYEMAAIGKRVSFGDKIGLFVIPAICFIGGSLNLYLAVKIIKNYKEERELWSVLSQEALFEGKDED